MPTVKGHCIISGFVVVILMREVNDMLPKYSTYYFEHAIQDGKNKPNGTEVEYVCT